MKDTVTLPLFPTSTLFEAKIPKLRPYQERGIQRLRDRVREGKKRILLVAPTGAGKTTVIAAIIRTSSVPVLFVAHRMELIDQCVKELAAVGITNVGVIRGNDNRVNPNASIQIASIQTLSRRDKPEAGIVFVDECFPAGTLVSGRPIEAIRIGDLVDSFDPKTGFRCVRPVVRVFRKEPSSLVRLTINGETLVCTPNHRIWTSNGWVEAKDSLGQNVAVLPIDLRFLQQRDQEETSTLEHPDALRSVSTEVKKRQSKKSSRDLQTMLEADCPSRKELMARAIRSILLRRSSEELSTCNHNTIDVRHLWERNRKASQTQQYSVVLRELLSTEKREEKKIHHSSVCHLQHSGKRENSEDPYRKSLLFGAAQKRISETNAFEETIGVQPSACIRENASTKSDAKSRCALEDGAHASLYRTSSSMGRRQRTRVNGTTTTNDQCTWAWMDPGASDRDEERKRSTQLHLHRSSKRVFKASDRSGREIAWASENKRSRCPQGVISSWVKVDSVEVLESGSDGKFGGLCPEGIVYNLEVEGTHTYFANGIAVSNCHRAVSDSYLALLEHYKQSIILGFTASPTRYDGRPLGNLFECLDVIATYEGLIKDKFIIPPLCYGGPVELDLSSIKTVGGDYDDGPLGELMRDVSLVGQLLEHWRRLANMYPRENGSVGLVEGPLRRTFIFAVGIQHSIDICTRFEADGVRIAHLDGTTPETERKRIINALGCGELDAVTNVGVLLEGVDIPSAKCVVHARPTQSIVLWRQSAGRIFRPWHPGCRPSCREHPSLQPLLLDHAGNIARHGFPHEDLHWELTTRARSLEKKVATRICPKCYAYLPAYKRVCPYCDHEAPPPKPAELPKESEEQLRQLSGSPEEMRRMYFQMMAQVARAKGYKPGFVGARYKSRYGVWPPWDWSESLKSSFASDPDWQFNLQANQERKRKFELAKMAKELAKIENPDDW